MRFMFTDISTIPRVECLMFITWVNFSRRLWKIREDGNRGRREKDDFVVFLLDFPWRSVFELILGRLLAVVLLIISQLVASQSRFNLLVSDFEAGSRRILNFEDFQWIPMISMLILYFHWFWSLPLTILDWRFLQYSLPNTFEISRRSSTQLWTFYQAVPSIDLPTILPSTTPPSISNLIPISASTAILSCRRH
jgi:hypothetical protein